MKLVSCVLTAILLCTIGAPLRAETWSGDKTFFRQSGAKKWSKARIVARPGAIEVFSVPQGKLVARFDKGNVLAMKGGKLTDSNLEQKVSRGRVVAALGGLGAGLYLIAEDKKRRKELYGWRHYTGSGLLLGMTFMLLTDAVLRKRPYLQISDGLKKIDIRVKKDMNAFRDGIESALKQ